jgi:MOSC domain-containing protein YiiM
LVTPVNSQQKTAPSPLESAKQIRLVSVNVGTPRPIGRQRGRPVMSGIMKESVPATHLHLDLLNLQGDTQADQRVHGGPDKAVYAYPSEHLPAWSQDLRLELGPAAFGENLTTAGWLEDDVRIGDVWAWGEALLQVAQPRHPCFKLAMKLDRPEVIDRMLATGRTGWYLRVLEPGRVPVAGPIAVGRRHPAGVSVRRVHLAALPGQADPEELRYLLALEPLAGSWRRALERRLAALGG